MNKHLNCLLVVAEGYEKEKFFSGDFFVFLGREKVVLAKVQTITVIAIMVSGCGFGVAGDFCTRFPTRWFRQFRNGKSGGWNSWVYRLLNAYMGLIIRLCLRKCGHYVLVMRLLEGVQGVVKWLWVVVFLR